MFKARDRVDVKNLFQLFLNRKTSLERCREGTGEKDRQLRSEARRRW